MDGSTLEKVIDGHTCHGEKWGYTTHVLRESLIGIEDDYDIVSQPAACVDDTDHCPHPVYSKFVFVISIMTTELAKPAHERSEWIVYVSSYISILVS